MVGSWFCEEGCQYFSNYYELPAARFGAATGLAVPKGRISHIFTSAGAKRVSPVRTAGGSGVGSAPWGLVASLCEPLDD